MGDLCRRETFIVLFVSKNCLLKYKTEFPTLTILVDNYFFATREQTPQCHSDTEPRTPHITVIH